MGEVGCFADDGAIWWIGYIRTVIKDIAISMSEWTCGGVCALFSLDLCCFGGQYETNNSYWDDEGAAVL